MSDEPDVNLDTPPEKTKTGIAGARVSAVMVIYLSLIALFLLYFIYQLWPSQTPGQTGAAAEVILFGQSITINPEQRLLMIVIMTGALGSMVGAVRSLYFYIGNRKLEYCWLPMYFLRPVAGATLALVFYLVIRGGFFAPGASVQDTSPFGFAALSALVGLFSEEAVLKLKKVAEELFQPAAKEELASKES